MITIKEIENGTYSFDLCFVFSEYEATGYFIHNLLPDNIEVKFQDENYIEILLPSKQLYSCIITNDNEDKFLFNVTTEFIH